MADQTTIQNADLIKESLDNSSNHMASLCQDFGQAATCSAPQIMGAIINARQSAFQETMNDICKEVESGTPREQALEKAGLDVESTNLQCKPPATQNVAAKESQFRKIQVAGLSR